MLARDRDMRILLDSGLLKGTKTFTALSLATSSAGSAAFTLVPSSDARITFTSRRIQSCSDVGVRSWAATFTV